ncbi:MAG: SIMPL domain-containing protein [Spirochaetia bacterium]
MGKRKWFFVLVFLSACAALASAETADVERTISVTGEALVFVTPDEAVVTLGIETFNPSLARGQDLSAAAGKQVLDAIKALGVADKSIQTSDLTITIQYADSNHLSRGVEGYALRRIFTITLKDPSRIAAVVNAALQSGANILSGVAYNTTDLRKYRDTARINAIRAAKEKAAALTAELGCKVGKPRTISEGFLGYFGMASAAQMTQNTSSYAGGSGSSPEDEAQTVPVGQIGIRASVQVVFDIVP